jgi:hypothetical protein
MKTFARIIALVLMVPSVPVSGFAGDEKSGHSHAAISEARASEIATAEVQRLTAAKKLGSEWAGISVAKATQAGKTKDWVVQYDNLEAKDTAKKNLYVVISASGEVKAVNFKGIQKSHSHGSGAAHTH